MKLKNILLVYTKPITKVEKSTLEIVKKTLKNNKINFVISRRDKLNKKLFQNKDLIVVVGGDGTFLRTSHFIFDKTPIFGVNSNPKYKEGFFMSATKKDFGKKINKILKVSYIITRSNN